MRRPVLNNERVFELTVRWSGVTSDSDRVGLPEAQSEIQREKGKAAVAPIPPFTPLLVRRFVCIAVIQKHGIQGFEIVTPCPGNPLQAEHCLRPDHPRSLGLPPSVPCRC